MASASGDTLDRAFVMSRAAPLTRDPDPRVRVAAYAALAPSASMPIEDTVHAILITGLRDPDFYVRATVIGALADRPSAADLSAVLTSYTQAGRDSANDARLAAIQYVGALWKKDSSSLNATWLSHLAQTPVPADPLERAAGKGIPVWAKWSSVDATPRPLSWYEGVVREFVMPIHLGRTINATINTVRGPIQTRALRRLTRRSPSGIFCRLPGPAIIEIRGSIAWSRISSRRTETLATTETEVPATRSAMK